LLSPSLTAKILIIFFGTPGSGNNCGQQLTRDCRSQPVAAAGRMLRPELRRASSTSVKNGDRDGGFGEREAFPH